MFGRRLNGLTIVSIGFLVFMIYQVLLDRSTNNSDPLVQNAPAAGLVSNVQAAELNSPDQIEYQAAPIGNPDAVAAPYDEYVLTQGPHGFSYGHMAIDLTAGKGATIKSPINGVVTQKFTDEYGNPTLVIENEHYQVTLLHGKYTVVVDDIVSLGDPIGSESNKGYTLDFRGNLCTNRDCGYHTHLNIFDKQYFANVNPMKLISP